MTEHFLVRALREIIDPEVGMDIVALGLVRRIAHAPGSDAVAVVMTLTTPACPAGATLAAGVRRRLERVPGIARVEVAISLDPPWTPADLGRLPDLSPAPDDDRVTPCAASPSQGSR